MELIIAVGSCTKLMSKIQVKKELVLVLKTKLALKMFGFVQLLEYVATEVLPGM